AGAARMAIAGYLGDHVAFAAAREVLKGWLGDRSAWHGFQFTSSAWQAYPDHPVPINALGTTKPDSLGTSRSIDGVLPEVQAKAAEPAGTPPTFVWDVVTGPTCTSEVWRTLEPIVLQALLVTRAGRLSWGETFWNPWSANDEAIERAFAWMDANGATLL